MINSIFHKLKPTTVHALNTADPQAAIKEIDIEELLEVLNNVHTEIQISHASLQKLYQEMAYVDNRLDYMEKSYREKQNIFQAKKNNALNIANDEDEDGGNGSDSTDDGGSTKIEVEKVFSISQSDENNIEDKLEKLQIARVLTKNLLNSIESLSVHNQESFSYQPDKTMTPA